MKPNTAYDITKKEEKLTQSSLFGLLKPYWKLIVPLVLLALGINA
jgi:hypothetical protein